MKNKIAALLFCLVLSVTSLAQGRKLKIGLNIFPNYSKDVLSLSNDRSTDAYKFAKENEIGKFSFSATVFGEYRLSNRSFLGFGIGVQSNGGGIKEQEYLSFDEDKGFLMGFIGDPENIRIWFHHRNIELPFYYKNYFSRKFYILSGFSSIINVDNLSYSNSEGKNKGNNVLSSNGGNERFRRLNISVNMGLGWDFLEKLRYTLFVQPYVQYGVLGLIKESITINRNAFSVGLVTGIKI